MFVGETDPSFNTVHQKSGYETVNTATSRQNIIKQNDDFTNPQYKNVIM